MPVKIQDELLPRSIMLLCLGTATLVLLTQWSGIGDRFPLSSPSRDVYNRPIRAEETATELQLPEVLAHVLPKGWVGIQENDQKSVVSKETRSGYSSAKPMSQPDQTAFHQADSKLVVDVSDRQVYVYKLGKLLASYRLAVAQPGWETPTGVFPILNMERHPTWIHPITGEAIAPGPDNPLGIAWVGFWSDGKSEIGFHGTNQEELIGEAVSHGCLRMRNQDIEALYGQVTLGTLVSVQE
jgi:lipoprotein-anchoring transpeptidase ErfK/SrfK